jgi:putative ABC transport system permease protein
MKIFRMAWRNVLRNRRRSGVTVAAMSLALFVMVLYSALVEGYLVGMERNALDLEVGDVQVYAAGYRKDPSLHSRMTDASELATELTGQGYPASPRLLGAGLAAAGENSAGVALRGVNVELDAAVSEVHLNVMRGKWLDPADPTGVVLGKRLARMLGVEIGDEVVVLSQGADGSMANELYTVRGVLKAIADNVDRSGVYLTEAAFRELLVVPDGAHQLLVRRPPGTDLDAAAAHIKEVAGAHEVKTWRQLMPTLASLLDSSRGANFFMFIIVYTAIGIVILNAMLMAVFERIREFGVLKAIGMEPRMVLRLVFTEATLMTGLALLIGGGLSLPGLAYLSRTGIDLSAVGDLSLGGVAWDPIWRAEVNAHTFVGPVITMVVIVALAVLYPALKAAFIRPVEAMRHH